MWDEPVTAVLGAPGEHLTPKEAPDPQRGGRVEDVVRRESNNRLMDSATPALVEARRPVTHRDSLNWALFAAVGMCVVFWAGATFGLVLILL